MHGEHLRLSLDRTVHPELLHSPLSTMGSIRALSALACKVRIDETAKQVRQLDLAYSLAEVHDVIDSKQGINYTLMSPFHGLI